METVGTDRLGAVYDVLSNSRRRDVLYELEAIEEGSIDELTEAVRRRERARGSSTAETDSIRISLCHKHLPLLAELDVIEYDPATDRVARGGRFDEVQATVAKVRECEEGSVETSVDNREF